MKRTIISSILLLATSGSFAESDEEVLERVRANAEKIFLGKIFYFARVLSQQWAGSRGQKEAH